MRRVAVLFVLALVIGAGVGVLAYRLRPDGGGARPSTERVLSRPLNRGDAIAQVERLTAEVKRVDRVEARLTPASAIPPQMPVRPGEKLADGCVWAVAVAGDLVAFGGERWPWVVYKVDPSSGEIVGTMAGPGSWPDWVDDLPASC